MHTYLHLYMYICACMLSCPLNMYVCTNMFTDLAENLPLHWEQHFSLYPVSFAPFLPGIFSF